MNMQTTEGIMNQIGVKSNIFVSKTITVEEFVSLFDDRFHRRVIGISYKNGIINVGISFEEVEVDWYKDNTIHFIESENIGEVPYHFQINLDELDHIEMIDYWLDHNYPEIDFGARFSFIGNDGSEICIDADK